MQILMFQRLDLKGVKTLLAMGSAGTQIPSFMGGNTMQEVSQMPVIKEKVLPMRQNSINHLVQII